VLEAAQERIGWTSKTFPHLRLLLRRQRLHRHAASHRANGPGAKTKISVLFIDWEAQFSCTIEHVNALREGYRDVIEHFYWVALPLTTQNSSHSISLNGNAGRRTCAGCASRRKAPLPIRLF
jgi:predicted phosphoadenosine phosphosulfate sulfurtransferase